MADSNDQGGDHEEAAAAGTTSGSAPQTTLMSSFFPSPPAYFANFTQANLDLAHKLVAHPLYSLAEVKRDTEYPKSWQSMQIKVLKALDLSEEEIERLKDVDLALLITPPDPALVEEDGHWHAFGQAWPIHEKLPTLEEMGVRQLYKTPITWEDRRQALYTLLHTVLHTYLRLLSILTKGPPSLSAEQAAFASGHGHQVKTQADTAIEHIRVASINIHHLCNEWRPVQARETLKDLMINQIQERKRRTAEVREACKEISDRLAALKTVNVNHDLAEDLVLGTSSMKIDPKEVSSSKEALKELSIKEKAKARMRKRIAELQAS